MKHAIAIEFGGQSIKAALINQQGDMTSKNNMSLSEENPTSYADFEGDFTALLQATSGGKEISAVGVALPSPFDPQDLTLNLTQKPAYKHINGHALKSLLLDATGLSEYYTLNDAAAAGLGELWQGKIEERGRFLLLTLGTGLGGVFMQDGLIVTGRQVPGIPESGEIWDYPYRDTNLENVSGSTKAAVAIYRQLGGSDAEVLDGDLKKLATLARQDRYGVMARMTFAEFGRRLGDGIAPIVKQFRPQAIVLSGNIALAYDVFAQAAQETLQAGLRGSGFDTKLLQSELIDRGGLLGAAYRALYPQRPFRAG